MSPHCVSSGPSSIRTTVVYMEGFMRAIRDIIEIKSNRISYNLPSGFSDGKVELIVLSVDDQSSIRNNPEHKTSISLRGALKDFSNPALLDRESGAWNQAAMAKYSMMPRCFCVD